MFKYDEIVIVCCDSPFHAGKKGIFKGYASLNPEMVTLADVDYPVLLFAVQKCYVNKFKIKDD